MKGFEVTSPVRALDRNSAHAFGVLRSAPVADMLLRGRCACLPWAQVIAEMVMFHMIFQKCGVSLAEAFL